MSSSFFLVALLVAACLALTSGVLIPTGNRGRAGVSVKGADDWDYILFVQRWPASVCVDGHPTKTGSVGSSEKCSFPPEMAPNVWLMHGIWPTKTGTEGPVNCDANATWSIQPVNPILTELKTYWSNLESNTAVDSFWEHEWLKHGTCAQSLPALVGEFNFFNIPLTLQQEKYNFYQALASQQIVPDASKKYSHEEFTSALDTAYGKAAEVWCTYSKDTKEHYVAEMRLCLTKTFELMDCPESSGLIKSSLGTASCPQGTDLVYAPIKPNRSVLPPRPTRRVRVSQH